MFLSQAHSFTQQARLAITLAWVAGYTNILTLLTCATVTSHVSGTASLLGEHVAAGHWGLAGFALFLLGMFFVGAALSGACTELGRSLGWASIYVLPMAVEALLLAVFALVVEFQYDMSMPIGTPLYVMTGIASMAMGVQNATITRISAGVVRTTHVTGVLTDLGLEAVQFVFWLVEKRRLIAASAFSVERAHALARSIRAHPSSLRVLLLASIICSFALGAGLGTVGFRHLPRLCMFPPVLFLLWIIYQDVRRPIAELEESDLVSEFGLNLPESIVVYSLHGKMKGRDGRRMGRMPNLLAWADRLPVHTRVVILDIGHDTLLDANAAMELRALVARLEAMGLKLVLSGIDQTRFEELKRAGAGRRIDVESVSPDLELAIARGFNFVHRMNLEG